jgi:ribonuclease HI
MTDLRAHFAGMTGPEASGGIMVSAFVILRGDEPIGASAIVMGPGIDSSWHSATYHALAYVLEQWRGRLDGATFMTDDQLVVKQMLGLRRAKDGHYIEAREDALDELARTYPVRDSDPPFVWIPADQNAAREIAGMLMRRRGVVPWSYKKGESE